MDGIIKRRRVELGLSADDVAEKVGVSRSTVFRWERGDIKKTTTAQIQRLSDILGLSPVEIIGMPDWLSAPVYAKIAGGVPAYADNDVIGYIGIDPKMAKRGEYIGIRVKGHSMEPRIMDGDIAVLLKQPTVESGEVAAVMIGDDEATLKQVKYNTQGMTLVPFNPDFSEIAYTWKEAEEYNVRIIGKLVEVRRVF